MLELACTYPIREVLQGSSLPDEEMDRRGSSRMSSGTPAPVLDPEIMVDLPSSLSRGSPVHIAARRPHFRRRRSACRSWSSRRRTRCARRRSCVPSPGRTSGARQPFESHVFNGVRAGRWGRSRPQSQARWTTPCNGRRPRCVPKCKSSWAAIVPAAGTWCMETSILQNHIPSSKGRNRLATSSGEGIEAVAHSAEPSSSRIASSIGRRSTAPDFNGDVQSQRRRSNNGGTP
jgi:hypothetical protein